MPKDPIKFKSPQEEAFEIAYFTRKRILGKEEDIISVLRSCLVVATNLSKEEDIEWIKGELNGYFDSYPHYRIINCAYEVNGRVKDDRKVFDVGLEMGLILYHFNNKENIRFSTEGGIAILTPIICFRLIEGAITKCLNFLNECLSELQYGGYVQSFFERIRKKTESKLSKINSTIPQEMQSVYINLISKNPTDWPKVAYSCRRILKFVSDKVFPPSNKDYVTKDGRSWKMKDNNYINRLICFFDKKSLDIASGECEFIEKYLRRVNKETQDGTHKENFSQYEASLIAIHTYLIASEVVNKFFTDEKGG